jgi:formylglycine-generating enzyme required for sulfatase activity
VGSSRNADVNAMPNPSKGTAALFACKGGERAFESARLGKGHGIFFYHVIEALRGGARDRRGNVTWDRLTAHVRDEVSEDVERLVGGGAKQTPHLMANVEGNPVLVPPGLGRKQFTNSVGMKLVRIPATGEKGFWMGSDETERREVLKALNEEKEPDWLKAEGPRHKVILSKEFFLGVTEVTQGQYRAVMGSNPSYFSKGGPGKDRVKDFTQDELDSFPVESVSWDDAQEFLKKLNALVGEKKFKVSYRLPTEAEWEYACRGGADVKEPFTFKKPSKSISSAFANFVGNYPFGGAGKGASLQRPTSVGSFKDRSENPFGLHDMHGNVYEWCQDWYAAGAYTRETRRDPSGPPQKGVSRVIRGGGWANKGVHCRSAYRRAGTPADRLNGFGFRVAADPSE